jgi:hypothetical protein
MGGNPLGLPQKTPQKITVEAEVRLYRPARPTDPATGVLQNGLRIARGFNHCTLANLATGEAVGVADFWVNYNDKNSDLTVMIQ